MDKKISDKRQELDEIDRQLVELLNRRAEIAQKVGKLKESGGLPVFSAAHEEKIFSEIIEKQAGPFPRNALRVIFSEIVSACRSIQGPNRISALGEKYSVSHSATLQMFGSSSALVPMEQADKMLSQLHQGTCSLGVIPLPSGSAYAAVILEEFLAGKLFVVSETMYRQSFVLAGRNNIKKMDISKIFLTREVLALIRPWVASHSVPVQFTNCLTMEEAVENLDESAKVAAVLPLEIAHSLGLHIIDERVETQVCEDIRCVVVSHRPNVEFKPTMKATALVTLSEKPGALHGMLSVLKDRDLPLLGLRMYQFPGKPWHDLILIDFSVPPKQESLQKTLKELEEKAVLFKFLGFYPVMPQKDVSSSAHSSSKAMG